MNLCRGNKEISKILLKFEDFLSKIPLEKYRNELMSIKTVEQNLPRSLNPLPAIYESYWLPKQQKFMDYEKFFEEWWKGHLKELDVFIRRYFFGCSYQFVYLGFKARIYRTFISVLTQFHFCYLWLCRCKLPLKASAELDLKGIDALIEVENLKVALQIKKETYRSEARGSGHFASRRVEADLIVEVPYTIGDYSNSGRKQNDEGYERYKLLSVLSKHMQRYMDNGFVVFQPDYPELVEQLVTERLYHGRIKSQETIQWSETLRYITEKGI